MAIRVAVIEDDPRYRASLEDLFSLSPGFELVASFSTGRTAVHDAARRRQLGEPQPWDVVVTDLDMPEVDGIEATRKLKEVWPSLPVVILTVFENPPQILQAICAGADGYLLKKASVPEILDQLRIVVAGGAPLTPGVARTMMDLLRDAAGPVARTQATRVDLTVREQQVLEGLVRGLAYKEVAAELGVSLDTVRTYIRSLYKKLQVHSVAAAVSRALKDKLV